MTRSQIQTTVLLACTLILGACQKDEKTNKRTRVNAQMRMSKKSVEQKSPTADQKAPDEEEQQVMPSEICSTEGPLYCPAIRVAALDNGTIINTGRSTTAKVAEALKLAIKNENVTKTTSDQLVTFVIKNKIENERAKLVVVLASQNDDKKLVELAEVLTPYSQVRVEKLVMINTKKDQEAAADLKLTADEKILILSMAGDTNSANRARTIVLNRAKKEQVFVQEVKATTFPEQLEGKALQLIGTRIYLKFVLPVELAKIESSELLINATPAQRDGSEYVVENENGAATLLIKDPSIIKKITDTVTIKYTLKAD